MVAQENLPASRASHKRPPMTESETLPAHRPPLSSSDAASTSAVVRHPRPPVPPPRLRPGSGHQRNMQLKMMYVKSLADLFAHKKRCVGRMPPTARSNRQRRQLGPAPLSHTTDGVYSSDTLI